MKPFYAPLFEALIHHSKSDPLGFHVPGHQYGKAIQPFDQIKENPSNPVPWFSAIMQLDVTELSTTDDLHHPEASIKEAQQLAAQCFGSEETYFLVGGSTSGNIAMILTVCEPGDLIIVQRNVHKSIINGMKLAGAAAVFLTPQVESDTGLATIPSLQQVEEALQLYPEAKAIFLSNPNYYGRGVNLKDYADLAHQYGKPLIVDEAHGAHYGFHESLPQSALAAGADAVIQSAHKTLPALTMGAMLHIQGNRIQRDIVGQFLAMIQSSSPSFPILASLDISRAMIDSLGGKLFEQCLISANSFRKWMKDDSTFIKVVQINTNTDDPAVDWSDPLRVILFDSSGLLTGFELQRHLEEYGCFAEMADPHFVVLIFGIQTSEEEVKRLQQVIVKINNTLSAKTLHSQIPGLSKQVQQSLPHATLEFSLPEPVLFARERFKNKKSVRVPIIEAVHQMAAEMVTPYPPGICILYPGEIISAAVLKQIQQLSAVGAKFQGALDPTLSTIAVYKE